MHMLYYQNQSGINYNRHLIVINGDNDRVITDSAEKTLVKYSISVGTGSSWEDYGFIDRREILDSISKKQTERIKELLAEKNENGSRNIEDIVIGRSVDVLYDENDPSHFHLADDDANEEAAHSLMRFGLIIIAGAAVLTVCNHVFHIF